MQLTADDIALLKPYELRIKTRMLSLGRYVQFEQVAKTDLEPLMACLHRINPQVFLDPSDQGTCYRLGVSNTEADNDQVQQLARILAENGLNYPGASELLAAGRS